MRNLHFVYDNGCNKNSPARTGGRYKRSVRMFRNAGGYLMGRAAIHDNLAPSYFLESMVYKGLDADLTASFQETFCRVVNTLNNMPPNQSISQNEQVPPVWGVQCPLGCERPSSVPSSAHQPLAQLVDQDAPICYRFDDKPSWPSRYAENSRGNQSSARVSAPGAQTDLTEVSTP